MAIISEYSQFTGGISTRTSTELATMPVFDPLVHTYFFDDFYKYLPSATDWVLTETQAGATQAQTAGHGGQLLITNSAADNDVVSIQHSGVGQFAFAAGRKAWMSVRFQVSDATQSDLFLGLASVDTSPVASLPTSYAAFVKDDDAATILFKTSAGYNTGALATVTAATWMRCSLYYDGALGIQIWIDGALVHSGSVASFSALFPSAVVLPTLALQNGEAVAKTATYDYFLAGMDR